MASHLIKRLLITRHDKIGDFVLTLPLCKAIKKATPEVEISVLVSKVNTQFAHNLEFINHVIEYKPSFWSTVQEIRKHRFDASISCFIDNRLGAMLWMSGIKRRISPATKLAQIFFNESVSQRRSLAHKTEWQYNLDLGRVLFPTLSLDYQPPLIHLHSKEPSNRVVFHPGSGGSSDGNLRVDDYLRLAKRASEIPGIKVVFTFGPGDQKSFEEIRSKLSFDAELIQSQGGLTEFCNFLAQIRLFVSTSTGPMHLAGAVNTPTLSFFGKSLFAGSRRWAPISDSRNQKNFMLGKSYSQETYNQIETIMVQTLQSTI